MSSSPAAGLNDRYSPRRFKGAEGDHGANIYPYSNEDIFSVPGANGVTDGNVTWPAGTSSFCVLFDVSVAFSMGTTVIVGIPGSTNLFVQLADAVDLTTTGLKQVTVELPFPSAQPVRVTIAGGPVAGLMNVVFQAQV